VQGLPAGAGEGVRRSPGHRLLPDNEIDESFSLEKYRGRYVALFFYPLDFTFVCPSEILAFDHRLEEFRKRDCEVIGVSVFVRHQVVNDLGLGRNIDDVLRTLDALQHTERSGDVCPANWEKGREAMEPTAIGVKKFLKDLGLEL
jgi:alkyl hydroperoxide reductase subunit AhpC